SIKTGDLYCWGQNSNGQLGTGNYDNVIVPSRTLIGFFLFLRLYRFFGVSRDLMWNWRGIWDFR
ncbi:MAG TPA: RCC1 domain-containing protein, partial [bacterium]|nr:RCC1 domain-containing protein [bacterium]